MKEYPHALIMYDLPVWLESLRTSLDPTAADGCPEDRATSGEDCLLAQMQQLLVLTDSLLHDGNSVHVLTSAGVDPAPENVIVIGRCTEVPLHLAGIECGTFDFILPPFEFEGLPHVLISASDASSERKEILLGIGWA